MMFLDIIAQYYLFFDKWSFRNEEISWQKSWVDAMMLLVLIVQAIMTVDYLCLYCLFICKLFKHNKFFSWRYAFFITTVFFVYCWLFCWSVLWFFDCGCFCAWLSLVLGCQAVVDVVHGLKKGGGRSGKAGAVREMGACRWQGSLAGMLS